MSKISQIEEDARKLARDIFKSYPTVEEKDTTYKTEILLAENRPQIRFTVRSNYKAEKADGEEITLEGIDWGCSVERGGRG